jgi:hypothetical protein
MEVLKLTTENDWLKSDKKQLKLFEADILPSYSTIWRSLYTDYKEYSTLVDETYASYC